MKTKKILILIFLIIVVSTIFPQQKFRKAIFLHRSVGGNVLGPNGSNTSVAQEMSTYNSTHGYTGNNAVTMADVDFPWNNSGNAWWEWHKVFDKQDVDDDIYQYIDSPNYDIIVIKTCFTTSGLTEGWGSPADTVHYDWKSVEVLKWHVRSILKIMENHPDKFFMMWNLVPVLNNGDFSPSVVRYDSLFSYWMKDTLATGKDPVYGAFPHNAAVFDMFGRLKNRSNNYINQTYTVSSSDNHLNAAGTELIAPQFTQELFDAAIAYESLTPVELTLFSASLVHSGIELNWSTATELNNSGFEIQKKINGDEFTAIGFVKGQGTSSHIQYYSFLDNNVNPGVNTYRLKQLNINGNYEYSKILEVDSKTINTYNLEQNYPNPFNPATEISFTIPKSGDVILKVYNISGSEVATLVNGFLKAGRYAVKFNAKDDTSGIYFYRIITDNFTSTRKMLLIK